MVKVQTTPDYDIFSGGNGLFAQIVCRDGRDIFLQGQDASRFWDDLDGANERYTANDVCTEYFCEMGV